MREGVRRPGLLPWLMGPGACFAAAVFFRFAVVGYSTLALCFGTLGILLLLFHFLPRGGKIALVLAAAAGAAAVSAALVPVVKAARGTPETDADYLIVLGAGVNGSTPSLSMHNRLTAALRYLEAHPQCTAIVSGGQGPGEMLTEAEVMHRWLTQNGIAGERIIMEKQATSTLENLEYSLACIPAAALETADIAVVSSEYHLCRAQYLAGLLGYSVAGVPARTTLPALKINYYIREALGMLYYRLFPPVLTRDAGG